MLMKTPPDLTQSSWKALSYLLRHRELWPQNFKWDFRKSCNCAVGLAEKIWETHPSSMYFPEFNPYGCQGYLPIPDKNVTPEIVADKIDDLLNIKGD